MINISNDERVAEVLHFSCSSCGLDEKDCHVLVISFGWLVSASEAWSALSNM